MAFMGARSRLWWMSYEGLTDFTQMWRAEGWTFQQWMLW